MSLQTGISKHNVWKVEGTELPDFLSRQSWWEPRSQLWVMLGDSHPQSYILPKTNIAPKNGGFQ